MSLWLMLAESTACLAIWMLISSAYCSIIRTVKLANFCLRFQINQCMYRKECLEDILYLRCKGITIIATTNYTFAPLHLVLHWWNARFFCFSAKRQRLLDRAIHRFTPAATSKKLKDACRTSWVQRIDSYIVFLELLSQDLPGHCLPQLIRRPRHRLELGWKVTIKKANGFLYQLESSTSWSLSRFSWRSCRISDHSSQSSCRCKPWISSMHTPRLSPLSPSLRRWGQSECEFKRMFTDAGQLGKDLHGEEFVLTKPRVTRHQVHRSNVQASTAEIYHTLQRIPFARSIRAEGKVPWFLSSWCCWALASFAKPVLRQWKWGWDTTTPITGCRLL